MRRVTGRRRGLGLVVLLGLASVATVSSFNDYDDDIDEV